ncbi:peptidase M35 [Massilia sp. WF1]|uniref:M35 family metallo-endopeptidase n=1 Tax=unclassified Massilia TaxID=2609279 RepID=UPI00064B27E7|nr:MULTISPECIES: M35 family metallo-endopeptidase [unclassified Massilia]ALK98543.1 peptidase M35 [Massilia sp. WG5]KLU35915.1 peptidase M35 [Massilia sp. WF1]
MNCKSIMGAALIVSAMAGAEAALAAAAGEVTVSVTPERQNLAKSDDVVVRVTVTNASAATQYLLKWQTPFGAIEAPLFEVTRDGLPVRYLGMQVKRPAPGAADYVALKPGASRSVRVELSALYDMAITGAYSVRWRADATQVFSRPGVARASARPETGPAAVWIDGRLPRGAPEASAAAPESPAGLSFNRCSNAQQETIASAAQAAQAMAQDANLYLQAKALGARYGSWFGAVDAERSATALRHFQAIGDAFANKPVTVDCSCKQAYYAYVYPNQPYRIYVCKAFWSAPPTGTDSKGGTLVHEMSHFTVVAGTDDLAYGQAAAGQLAASDPARALNNADSHEYFGENTPHLELR